MAYLQLMAQRSADAQAVVIDSGNGGFNVARLLRTGIYVPISEAFGTFYQVGLSLGCLGGGPVLLVISTEPHDPYLCL